MRLLLRLAVVLYFIFLLASDTSYANNLGVIKGQMYTYNYTIVTSYPTPNGEYTQVQENQFSVQIVSTNASSDPATVTYIEKILMFNNATVSDTRNTVNVTSIFDPYDNRTYLPAIGFYPFTYYDLKPGKVTNLIFEISLTNTPFGMLKTKNIINATITRSQSYIFVNFTASQGAMTRPSTTWIKYNSSDGVMLQEITKTHFSNVNKDFLYYLVKVERIDQGPNLLPLVPVIILISAFIGLRILTIKKGNLRKRV